MAMLEQVKTRWHAFSSRVSEKKESVKKTLAPVNKGYCAVKRFIYAVAEYIVRFRKIIMATPVMIAMAKLAQYSYQKLPEMVGIALQNNGEYAQMISRNTAVLGPVVITSACLVLMFCSRKTVYPWLISIFSLILPILLIVTNVFPA